MPVVVGWILLPSRPPPLPCSCGGRRWWGNDGGTEECWLRLGGEGRHLGIPSDLVFDGCQSGTHVFKGVSLSVFNVIISITIIIIIIIIKK